MKPHAEVSHKKFAERLERQANDGHHWNQAPEMMLEAARRIRGLVAALECAVRDMEQEGLWGECQERLRAAAHGPAVTQTKAHGEG